MPSETFYHAYLPPPTLPPLSLPGDGVTFHRIHLAPSLAGKIVERDEDAEDEGGKRISRQPDVAVESLPSDDAGNALGPRARRSSHHEPDPDVSSRSSDRRRSKRLRLSGSLFEDGSQLSSLDSQGVSDPTATFSNIPRWTIPLARLTALEDLLAGARVQPTKSAKSDKPNKLQKRRSQGWNANARVHLLACVMEVTAPVQRKGLWVASWRVSVPTSREPAVCEVVLWKTCAVDYGSMVRKGDVVLLEDVEFRPGDGTAGNDAPRIVIAPATGWAPGPPTIAFRTLPRYSATHADYIYHAAPRGAVPGGERGPMVPQDRALRPDLSLARSDPGIRRIAELAHWCAEWVGGEAP